MRKGTDTATFLWLGDVARGKRRWIAILLLIQAVLGATAIGYAVFLRGIVDSAVGGNRQELIRNAVLMVSLLLFQVGLRAVFRFLEEHTKASIENALKKRLFSALLNRDYAAVTATHSGEWMNRLTSDTRLVSADLTDLIPNLGGMVVRMAAALGMLLSIDSRFGILIIVGGGGLILLTMLLRRRLKALHRNVQAADGRVRVFLSERLGSMLTIRAFGREDITLDQAQEQMAGHKAERMKKVNFSNLCNSAMSFSLNGVYSFGAVYCAYQIWMGVMSYGTFTAVLQLINEVQGPIGSISSLLPKYYAMLASADRIMEAETFAAEDKHRPVEDMQRFYREDFRGLSLKNAFFTYRQDRESPELLRGLDLTIGKGEYVAFTGPSGCGKSTVLKLLMCMYPLDSGERSVMSTNGEFPLTAGWRELYAYVPQGNQLMNGTIREVVTFGDKTAMTRDQDIYRALEIACAEQFVRELPDGLDTMLGERGAGLSEGQMQRVAVARAIFSNRPVLLLDEATSALDDETERLLLKNLRAMTERTVIIVTHRSAVLDVTDQEIRFQKPEQNQ
jgi:ATP-binding cassette subfamily B protein